MGGSGRCALRSVLYAACCSLVATPAAAQWRAEVQAGRLLYDAAPEAATTSVVAALSYSTVSASITSSLGVPFARDEPAWLAVQALKRFSAPGDIAFGVDIGADGFGYHLATAEPSRLPLLDPDATSATGWGAAAEVMPFAAWYSRRVDIEARAGVVSFISDGSHVAGLKRAAFVADAYAHTASWHDVSVRFEGKWVRAAEGGFPFAAVTIVRDGPVAVWGTIGRWFDDAAETASWRAGAALTLGSRVALLVNGEHEEIDPVYATPARTTWGAGLRVLLGRRAVDVREPVPDAYADGVATIRLDAAALLESGTPSIAGDFNGWTPEPMTLDSQSGTWAYRAPLAPGVYHFAFVDAAGNWFVPEGTPGRRADGMGGYVAVLVVEEP